MIARHHLGRNVVEAAYHCNRCGKQTMHRVDQGRKGPCLECGARREARTEERKPAPVALQGGLF